jgi:rubrerythrin
MRVNIGKEGKITVTDFSSVQTYKIAVKMEKDGIQFYTDLLKSVKDKGAQAEIRFLIGQEEEHLKTFDELLRRQKESAGDSFEEDDIVDYLEAHVFSIPVDKGKAMDHRHTAFEEAMNMEKRSIVFYESCLFHVRETEARKAFKNVLEEERKHFSLFAGLLRDKCINSQKGCLL